MREELRARGHRFRSRCDTETVLRGWIEWGPAVLPRLDGMFALAVLDGGRLTLARDRTGIKPLYHAMAGPDGPFLFASEIPALLRSGLLARTLNARALADFTALGHPTGTDTFFDGVSALAPGHTLSIKWANGFGFRQHRFADLDDEAADMPSVPPEEAFGRALGSAVTAHLAADGPVAVSLSGGIDSTVLAFLAAEHVEGPPACFTAVDGLDHPDAVAARLAAAALGARHQMEVFDFDAYLAAIPATLEALAVPDLGPGPLFLGLCRSIGKGHKAALNGEGADEILCGYPAFLDPAGTLGDLNAGFARAAAAGLTASSRAFEIRDSLLGAAGNPLAFRLALQRVYRREQLIRCHLEPVDHLSMAASVEMRVPYLDRTVQRWGMRVSQDGSCDVSLGLQKRALRRFAIERFGTAILDIALRPKLQMPDAGRRHAARFAALADAWVTDKHLRRSALAPAFADKAGFLVFDLFRRLHLTGELAAGDDLGPALPDLVQAVA